MNAPLKGTPGAAWGSAVSPSITRRKSSVSNLFEYISSVSECVSIYTAVFQVWERLKALSGSLLCRWAPVAPAAWAPVHGVTETATANPLNTTSTHQTKTLTSPSYQSNWNSNYNYYSFSPTTTAPTPSARKDETSSLLLCAGSTAFPRETITSTKKS